MPHFCLLHLYGMLISVYNKLYNKFLEEEVLTTAQFLELKYHLDTFKYPCSNIL